MVGTIKSRVIEILITAGIPNNNVFKGLISFDLKCWIAPNREVTPTMNNEYTVAFCGSIRKKTTKMGTAKIEPPPPSVPITSPTKSAKKYPIISKVKEFRVLM